MILSIVVGVMLIIYFDDRKTRNNKKTTRSHLRLDPDAYEEPEVNEEPHMWNPKVHDSAKPSWRR